jgi:hypothetical protein
MANVKVKGATELQLALKEVAERLTSPKKMQEYGTFAAEMIRKRTRLGDGIASEGQSRSNKSKLKELKPGTVKNRTRMKERGELSQLTTPKRSNLTATGQLLNSVEARDAKRASVKVGPRGSRTDGKNNEDIGGYVTDAGRPFNNLSKVEVKRLEDAIKKDLKALLKARLTTK